MLTEKNWMSANKLGTFVKCKKLTHFCLVHSFILIWLKYCITAPESQMNKHKENESNTRVR